MEELFLPQDTCTCIFDLLPSQGPACRMRMWKHLERMWFLPSTELPAAAQWDSVRPQMSKNLARVDMGLDTGFPLLPPATQVRRECFPTCFIPSSPSSVC